MSFNDLSKMTRVTTSFHRPNNATPYTIGDSVGDAATPATPIKLANMFNGRGGIIRKLSLFINSAVVTLATFTVYLFKAPPTMVADNAPWTLLDKDLDNLVAKVVFPIMTTEGAGSDSAMAQDATLNVAIGAFNGNQDLYAVILAEGAYVPIANEKFTLHCTVDEK